MGTWSYSVGGSGDRKIVRSFRHADNTSLELLYLEYGAALQRFCRGRLTDPTEAGDASHEALLKAHRARHRFDPEARVWPWLATIAANVCKDFNRSHRRWATHKVLREAMGVEEEAESGVRVDIVREAMSRLKPHYRQVLFLKHFQGLTYAQTSVQMGRTEASIRSMLMRARRTVGVEIRRVAEREGNWPLPALVPLWAWRVWFRAGEALRGLSGRLGAALADPLGAVGAAAIGGLVAALMVASTLAPGRGVDASMTAPDDEGVAGVAQRTSPDDSPSQPGGDPAGAQVRAEVTTGGWTPGPHGSYETPSSGASAETDDSTGKKVVRVGPVGVDCSASAKKHLTKRTVCGALEDLGK